MAPLAKCAVEQLFVLVYASLLFALVVGLFAFRTLVRSTLRSNPSLRSQLSRQVPTRVRVTFSRRVVSARGEAHWYDQFVNFTARCLLTLSISAVAT
jgi:uncharacterized protein YneF (UPF0154 family)